MLEGKHRVGQKVGAAPQEPLASFTAWDKSPLQSCMVHIPLVACHSVIVHVTWPKPVVRVRRPGAISTIRLLIQLA